MLVIGHRGALWEGLENSFDSFQKAIAAGCNRIELDVWGAKDFSLWVCHDQDLKRTAQLSQKITELTKKDLQQIKLNNQEPIPELEVVLEKFLPQVELNLELKDSRKEVALKLVEDLAKIKDHSKVIISSFDIKPLEWIEKKDPSLQLALLWENEVSPDSKAFAELEEHPNWIFHPQADTLTTEIAKRLHKENKIIYPWVPRLGIEDTKREELWQKMFDLKVHGLCTNYPRELKQWLAKKVG